MPGVMIVISAPSGAGKTTIYREFFKLYPKFRFSVSYTTRSPRAGEVNGRDYHFVTEKQFRELIVLNEFIEWEENFGHLYGTSRKILDDCLREGRDVLLDIEPRGARKIKARYAEVVFVLVLPPSIAALEARLIGRGEDETVINRRLAKATEQISQADWYDYVIINDRLSQAVDDLQAIYLAHKKRRKEFKDKIKEIYG